MDYNRRTSSDLFTYHRCNRCKLVFLSPVPENLHDYYPNGYFKIPESPQELERLASLETYKLDLIRRFLPTGRILEIGPSFGAFAYLAKNAGFEVEAVEMDLRCCEFLKDKIGIRVINEPDISNAFLALAHDYDAVVLWHVIEHIPDPWSALGVIAGRIRPGGFLILAAPNPNALQFRILGKHWAHLDAPRHISLIPASLLADTLGSAGFTPILTTTKDAGSIGWNHFGWLVSLGNLAAGRGRWMEATLSFLGKIFLSAFSPLERIDGLGSAYTIIFKKVSDS